MTAARKVVVEFLGEDKGLGKTADSLGSRTSKLGGVLGSVGKAAAVGLGAGIVAGGAALIGMTKNAAEDEAAQRRLATAMRNTVGANSEQIASVEDWISKQGTALGVTDDELRPAFQKLVQATGSVSEAQRQMQIAMDVSAGTGKSLATVSTALEKANNGTTASLSRLGLKTKDAEGNTLSLKDALATMSTTFQGQAAAQADSLQGKMDRLRLIFDETKESIGARLIPIASSMADLLITKVVPAVGQVGDWISQHVLPVFQRLGGGDGVGVFEKIRTAVGPVIERIGALVQTVAGNLRPIFDQLVASWRSDVLPALVKLGAKFNEWKPTLTELAGHIGSLVAKFYTFASVVLGTVLPPVIQLIGFFLGKAIPVIGDVIGIVLKIINKMFELADAFTSALPKVAEFVSGLGDKIGNAIGFIKDIPTKAKNALGDLGHLLWNAGTQIIQGLIDGIENKLSDLKSKLSSVTSLIPDWKGPESKDKILLTPAGEALIEGLIDGIDKKMVPLQKVLTKVTDYIKAHMDKIKGLRDQRDQMVAGFSSFGSSIFSTQLQTEPNADGSAAASPLAQLVAQGQAQRAQAEQLQRDVKALISKGLSEDLVQQLAAAGQSGIDQIHALAGADQATINQVNLDNAAKNAALQAAGMLAANSVYQDDIRNEEHKVAIAEGIKKGLKDLLDLQDKNTIVELRIGGHVLHATLLELKRKTGRNLNLD